MTIKLFRDLNEEWELAVRSRESMRLLSRWKLAEPALAEFRDFESIVAQAHGIDRGKRDGVLAALLRCGRDDRLAWRVVLHIEMPGLVCIVNRFLPGPHTAEEVAATVVATAWRRIAEYPLDRRPRNIGGNIGLDTRQLASVALFRQAGREIPDADLVTVRATTPHVPDAARALVEVLDKAVKQKAVSPEDARLVALTRIYDVPVKELASLRGILPQSLRRRRLRVEACLAACVA